MKRRSIPFAVYNGSGCRLRRCRSCIGSEGLLLEASNRAGFPSSNKRTKQSNKYYLVGEKNINWGFRTY